MPASEGVDAGPVVGLGAAQPLPPIPDGLGAHLDSDLRRDLHVLLLVAPGQLGSVYRAMIEHPGLGPTELLPFTDCANAGALSNRRAVVYAVMQNLETKSPSIARQSARTVNTLIKSAQSEGVKTHLAQVLSTLDAVAVDAAAVEQEAEQLASDSAKLADALKTASGVYVYTYPHYWRHPYVPNTERRMLKVGKTINEAWKRVLTQAKQTGMPEDPLLLRVYKTHDPQGLEKTFHTLLDAAEHDRALGAAVGTEWFVTTIEFCDAVAVALKLEILEGSATT